MSFMRIIVLLLLLASFPAFVEASAPEGEPASPSKTVPPETVPSAEAYYHTLLGLKYEGEGQIDEALKEYEKALSHDRGSPFLLTRTGVMLARLGHAKDAIGALEKAKALQPSNVRALTMLADLYAAEEETTKAIAVYEEIILQEPKMERYLILARFFLTQKQADRAIATLERGVQADPSAPLGPYYLAKLFVQKKEHEKGLEQYQKAISLYPGFELAHLERAALYERLGQRDLAERAYRYILDEVNMEHGEAGLRLVHLLMQRKAPDEAMRILDRLSEEDPEDPDVWLKISLLWSEQHEFAKAMEALKKAMANRPPSLDITIYLASLYEGIEEYEKAAATYREVLQSEGDRYEVHLRLGSVYFYRLKKMPEALFEGDQAQKIDPKRPEAYLLTGLVLFESARFEEAAERFEKGIDVAPDRADLHFHLGATYDKLSRFDALVREMERVITIDSSHAMALNYLGYTYADRGIRLDEAIDLINRALVLQPDDGYFMDSLGWAYYKQGKMKEALVLIQKAAALVPDDPVILEHLGELYLKENQQDQAYAAWSLSLKLDSKNEKLKARIREAGFGDLPPSGT